MITQLVFFSLTSPDILNPSCTFKSPGSSQKSRCLGCGPNKTRYWAMTWTCVFKILWFHSLAKVENHQTAWRAVDQQILINGRWMNMWSILLSFTLWVFLHMVHLTHGTSYTWHKIPNVQKGFSVKSKSPSLSSLRQPLWPMPYVSLEEWINICQHTERRPEMGGRITDYSPALCTPALFIKHMHITFITGKGGTLNVYSSRAIQKIHPGSDSSEKNGHFGTMFSVMRKRSFIWLKQIV